MPEITVIVPSYNTPKEHIDALCNSLMAQTFKDFEVYIVDDRSEFDFYHFFDDERFHLLKMPRNCGPAKCRNMGVLYSESEKIFFTDSDCRLAENTLAEAVRELDSYDAVMGNTVTDVKTRFGKAVALLGFPGGGCIGFDKVWRVDENGFTNSVTSCNFAVNRKLFTKIGMFDTTFPVPGGEDTCFGKKIVAQNEKIRYNSNQVVFHVERSSFKSFKNWQITRGRGNYHIKRQLGSVAGFYRLRLWSFKNSLKASGKLFPIVAFLILASFVFQKIGYRKEANNFS